MLDYFDISPYILLFDIFKTIKLTGAINNIGNVWIIQSNLCYILTEKNLTVPQVESTY